MNFIERWFGISPDGGNGMFELSLTVAAITIVSVVVFRRRIVAFCSRKLSDRSRQTERSE